LATNLLQHSLVFTTFLLCLAGICQGATITQVPATVSVETGIQAGELELEYLGFDPSAFFFFTGNTEYDYNGAYELQIIAAALNPAGATSFAGVTTHEVTFVIDDAGNISERTGVQGQIQAIVPEPDSALLMAAGLTLALLLIPYALPRGTKFNDAEFMQ
jgi:hypothetical protein